MNKPIQDTISRRIAELEQRLEDLHARLPAHSIPTSMAIEMEALEDAIENLRKELQDQAMAS